MKRHIGPTVVAGDAKFWSVGRLMIRLGLTYNQLTELIACEGIESPLSVNGAPMYGETDVKRLEAIVEPATA